MMRTVIFSLFILFTTVLYAQNSKLADSLLLNNDYIAAIQQEKSNEGTITIDQDSRIHYLVNKHIKLNDSKGSIKGWRIQIYNSSGKESKEKAKKVKEKFLNKFPEISAYLIYQPPYFKIRVGDFRSKQEGYSLYKEIAKSFPVLYFVPDDINFPEVE